MLERVWSKGNPLALLVECKLIQPLWRTVCRRLKKLKIELPYDPAIPLLSIYPEKTIIQNDTCTPIFIATPFTITRSWQQPKCPSTDEWIKNDVVRIFHCIYVVHIYNGILLSHKKERNWVICRDVDGSRDCHTE